MEGAKESQDQALPNIKDQIKKEEPAEETEKEASGKGEG